MALKLKWNLSCALPTHKGVWVYVKKWQVKLLFTIITCQFPSTPQPRPHFSEKLLYFHVGNTGWLLAGLRESNHIKKFRASSRYWSVGFEFGNAFGFGTSLNLNAVPPKTGEFRGLLNAGVEFRVWNNEAAGERKFLSWSYVTNYDKT